MKLHRFPALARSSVRLAALALALGAAAAQAAPGCERCEDLPRLYRELLEQEFLRAKFQEWVTQSYYPTSISAMQSQATKALTQAMQGDLYGVLAPQAGGGAPGAAAPSFGTVISGGSCQLVEYVPQGAGKDPLPQPVTEQKVKDKLCKPLADFTLAHENSHIKSCTAARQSGDKSVETVEWFVRDDVKAYDAGIRVLREQIAALARKCQWSGSTQLRKPDQSMVVPTPEQISTLSKNVKAKAGAVRRATR